MRLLIALHLHDDKSHFWCRWWGSNPHVFLAQGILSFGPRIIPRVTGEYAVSSILRLTVVFLSYHRLIFANFNKPSLKERIRLKRQKGTQKRKLEGFLGGMLGQAYPLLWQKIRKGACC